MDTPKARQAPTVFARIRDILDQARRCVSRSVNTAQVATYWLIGREIVEEEQRGKTRASYGAQLLSDLSSRLKAEYGAGYSVQNLRYMRQFFLEYPALLDHAQNRHTACGKSAPDEKRHTMCGESEIPTIPPLMHLAPTEAAWRPGLLHPNLAWSLYRHLLKVDNPTARSFYEIEAIANAWSARELERQINSLLYERLALSKDKEGLMRLATQGQEIARPADAFKDPLIIEFLGLPESPRLVESTLEQSLVGNLQAFLLELGKGFAFVSRQERITLDGDHFYIDLVFYHAILKCYVLIDLKVGKLSHADLGQMQLYVNYYDQERRTEGDGPTLGLILCTDKNDAVVRYLLGPGHNNAIFTSRYKLHLPTEAELLAEMQRELKELHAL